MDGGKKKKKKRSRHLPPEGERNAHVGHVGHVAIIIDSSATDPDMAQIE